MLTKNDVRDCVKALLRLDAEAILQAKRPDEWYGWVAPSTDPDTDEPVPGYWIGEADEQRAARDVDLAESALNSASWALSPVTTDDPMYHQLRDHRDACQDHLTAAQHTLDEVRATSARVIERRREALLDRLSAQLFLKRFREASRLDWNLYNPAIPEDLRQYVQRQRARGVISPTSIVLLYLVTQSTIQHGAEFQTEAITAYDHHVDNPLAVAALDIDVDEREPTKQRRAYIKALQAKAILDRQQPAHENLDRRDALADFEYHGMPEHLGVLWLDRGECCERCKQELRLKIVHEGDGYRYVTVCPTYATPGCHYDPQSPKRSTRAELRDWATIAWAASA